MKFKLVEDISNLYKNYFHIVKNEVGNYLVMHNDESLAHKRTLLSGKEQVDPYCFGGRKKQIEMSLDAIINEYGEDIVKLQFLPRDVAMRYPLRTYDGQNLPEKTDESVNELEKRQKYHKKHQKGLSPFCKLNAGNVEKNIETFNTSSDTSSADVTSAS